MKKIPVKSFTCYLGKCSWAQIRKHVVYKVVVAVVFFYVVLFEHSNNAEL